MVSKKHVQTLADLSSEYLNWLTNPCPQKTIKSNFVDFDELINGGFKHGTLTIIASRPSMGKTAFALNLAENIAINQNIPIAYFSLESCGEHCAASILSSLMNIDKSKFISNQLSHEEVLLLKDVTLKITHAPLYFLSSTIASIYELCERIEELKNERDIQMVIIDYIQLIPTACFNRNDYSIALSEVTRALQNLALKLDIAIIALSQVNRRLLKRKNKRPKLMDLRQDGDFEQAASLVVFLYRDYIYQEEYLADKDSVEITVDKNKFGLLGTIRMRFNVQSSKFETLSPAVLISHYD